MPRRLPATRKQVEARSAELVQLDGMAQLAREAHLVVHVVVGRAPGVVEHAREAANRCGVECYADIRQSSIRVRFTP